MTGCQRMATGLMAAVLFLSAPCKECAGAELQDVSLVYKQALPGGRSPLFPGSAHQGVELGLNVDVVPGVFFDNRVHAETDASQFRSVGWQYSFGFRPWDSLHVYYEHHSQHRIDMGYSEGFPLEDVVAFKWVLKTSTKRGAWW